MSLIGLVRSGLLVLSRAMRSWNFLILLSVFGTGSSLLVGKDFDPVDAAEPLGGDFGDELRIIVEAPKNPRFAHLAWPKIVKTRDGTLVLAYSAGRYHASGGEGCPAVSISKDKGMTWSPPKILREFDQSMLLNNSANTALGVADDGSVVLLAMAYTGDERNGIFGLWSYFRGFWKRSGGYRSLPDWFC